MECRRSLTTRSSVISPITSIWKIRKRFALRPSLCSDWPNVDINFLEEETFPEREIWPKVRLFHNAQSLRKFDTYLFADARTGSTKGWWNPLISTRGTKADIRRAHNERAKLLEGEEHRTVRRRKDRVREEGMVEQRL